MGDVMSGQHGRGTRLLQCRLHTHTQHSDIEKNVFPVQLATSWAIHNTPLIYSLLGVITIPYIIYIICTYKQFLTTFDGWTKIGLELVYY